jgi:hypothetical protein
MDFSMQLEMTPQGLRVQGYTGLLADARGQYRGNWAAPNPGRQAPAEIVRLLGGAAGLRTHLEEFQHELVSALTTALKQVEYLGPVGIDAFVYRTAQGTCRLKPVVEINPRYTMGRLTLELMRYTCPGSHGLFRLVNRAEAHRVCLQANAVTPGASEEIFSAYAALLRARSPLRMEGEPAPRIRDGVVVLNDPERCKACLAWFQVSAKDAPRSARSLVHEGAS